MASHLKKGPHHLNHAISYAHQMVARIFVGSPGTVSHIPRVNAKAFMFIPGSKPIASSADDMLVEPSGGSEDESSKSADKVENTDGGSCMPFHA